MIHIATIHWMTDRWIDIQLRYLEKYVDHPYRVYACLNGVDEQLSRRFFFASFSDEESHAGKLNYLAERISEEAADDDVLLFLDGDAFPIAELSEPVAAMLEHRPLAAIRRDENVGEPVPHPSFCVTTVGFWREIEGDWSPGPVWRIAPGRLTTDVGSSLLETLENRAIGWMPILRTNVRNIHPVFFGVYGDLIYHHGSGFRVGVSRVDFTPLLRMEDQASDEFRRLREIKEREIQQQAELVFEKIRDSEEFPRDLFFGNGPLRLRDR